MPSAPSRSSNFSLATARIDAHRVAGSLRNRRRRCRRATIALVRCTVRICAPLTSDHGLARLVVSLADGDGRTEDEVAALIDRTSAEVSELRAMAYAEAGPAALVTTRECRGWPLVARKDRLTPAERQAADGHLVLCRLCRARLDEQRQSRDKIWVRGGGAVAQSSSPTSCRCRCRGRRLRRESVRVGRAR